MTVATATLTKVPNYVNGQWIDSKATEWLDVTNPATGEVIAQTPLSSAAEVAAAIEAAACGLSGMAAHAGRRPHSAAVQAEAHSRRGD